MEYIKRFVLLTSFAGLAILTGCAHAINISPKFSELERAYGTEGRNSARVGYVITETLRGTEVTTAGGGGDNVRYYPYRDIEIGFERTLASVFAKVTPMQANPTSTDLSAQGLDFYLVPEIITTSGGSGFFTWPPTSFTVDLSATVRDRSGTNAGTIRVVGQGTAETGERLGEYGIAGRRAVEDALIKFRRALLESNIFRSRQEVSAPPAPKEPATTGNVASRLQELKDLLDRGLIDSKEYDARRKAILDSL